MWTIRQVIVEEARRGWGEDSDRRSQVVAAGVAAARHLILVSTGLITIVRVVCIVRVF